MNSTTLKSTEVQLQSTASRAKLLQATFAGALLPFSFAPFHFPGLALLSFGLLFLLLKPMPLKRAFQLGFFYGISFFGIGVSWIYVSIHQYGHLHSAIAVGITFIFIAYLSLFTGCFAVSMVWLSKKASSIQRCLLFSALWCLFEYLRAILLGGFPWLSVGFGQIDSPLQHLLPLVGVPGVGFITCFLSCLFALSISKQRGYHYVYLTAFIVIMLSPLLLHQKTWTPPQKNTISVGVIQSNLSMRDKWDENLFWQLLDHYKTRINELLKKKKQLIVLPESAIPVPGGYISGLLDALDNDAKQKNSAILLGIPFPTTRDPELFYNALVGLGEADGAYFKQHLVAFGEFVPTFLSSLNRWLALPPNLAPGRSQQPLITVHGHPIASLICYELAFPELLRQQLPAAEWIVSVSDDGWFGHSLAVFQHVQMAQVLSKQTGRYQILANNDGLSALIRDDGQIENILPAFSAGLLESSITPKTGSTPWALYGDRPFLWLFFLIVFIYVLRYLRLK